MRYDGILKARICVLFNNSLTFWIRLVIYVSKSQRPYVLDV